MARTLTAGMLAAIAAARGTIVYLFQIETSSGTLRLCTAPMDIDWDGESWQGIGGAMQFGVAQESADPAAQGVELTLSGVEQSIIASVLNTQVRGRPVQIWMAHLDDNLQVAGTLEIFRGYQLADYRITERRPETGPGTCDVRTRVQSRVSVLGHPNPVRTNVTSHNAMLARVGLTTGDTFFQNVPAVAGHEVYWGRAAPKTPGTTRRGRPR